MMPHAFWMPGPSLDRTYEELKPRKNLPCRRIGLSLDRTYEELKLGHLNEGIAEVLVWIVPMRN